MSLQNWICSMKTDASAMRPACFWTLSTQPPVPQTAKPPMVRGNLQSRCTSEDWAAEWIFQPFKRQIALLISVQYTTKDDKRWQTVEFNQFRNLWRHKSDFWKVVAPQNFKLKTCYSTSFKNLKLKVLWRHNILNWKVVAPQNPNLKSCGATKS